MRRDRDQRPELCRGSVEYIATPEFCKGPKKDPCYLFVIDASANSLVCLIVNDTLFVARMALMAIMFVGYWPIELRC